MGFMSDGRLFSLWFSPGGLLLGLAFGLVLLRLLILVYLRSGRFVRVWRCGLAMALGLLDGARLIVLRLVVRSVLVGCSVGGCSGVWSYILMIFPEPLDWVSLCLFYLFLILTCCFMCVWRLRLFGRRRCVVVVVCGRLLLRIWFRWALCGFRFWRFPWYSLARRFGWRVCLWLTFGRMLPSRLLDVLVLVNLIRLRLYVMLLWRLMVTLICVTRRRVRCRIILSVGFLVRVVRLELFLSLRRGVLVILLLYGLRSELRGVAVRSWLMIVRLLYRLVVARILRSMFMLLDWLSGFRLCIVLILMLLSVFTRRGRLMRSIRLLMLLAILLIICLLRVLWFCLT